MQIRTALLCQDAGPWKVLESVAAGRAEHLNRTGVGFASSCFFTDMLNASNSQRPRSAQQVWPHTGHLHKCTHIQICTCVYTCKRYLHFCLAQSFFILQINRISYVTVIELLSSFALVILLLAVLALMSYNTLPLDQQINCV